LDTNLFNWINFGFEIAQVLAALFALWLAAGVILAQLGEEELEDELEVEAGGETAALTAKGFSVSQIQGDLLSLSRGLTLVVWFLLSGFFFLPIADILTWIRTAIFLGAGWEQMVASPAGNAWGILNQGVYFLLTILLMAVIYIAVIWIGRKYLAGKVGASLFNYPLSKIERLFVLLGAAAIVHYIIRNLLLTLIWIDYPTPPVQEPGGAFFFLAPALVGILVLGLVALWMNSAIIRRGEVDEFDEEDDDLLMEETSPAED
jgi:hypothetical protein